MNKATFDGVQRVHGEVRAGFWDKLESMPRRVWDNGEKRVEAAGEMAELRRDYSKKLEEAFNRIGWTSDEYVQAMAAGALRPNRCHLCAKLEPFRDMAAAGDRRDLREGDSLRARILRMKDEILKISMVDIHRTKATKSDQVMRGFFMLNSFMHALAHGEMMDEEDEEIFEIARQLFTLTQEAFEDWDSFGMIMWS